MVKDKIILILDDNETTRLSLKKIFEANGATVYFAGHMGKGEAILTGLMSNGNYPSLIITDVKLPGNYGFEVLRKIQDCLLGEKIPILLLSRALTDFALSRASLYGVVGYARKPILISDIYKFSVEIIEAHGIQKPLHLAPAA